MRLLLLLTLLPIHALSQLPATEDVETKSRRDPIHDGIEVREVRESAAKDVGEALGMIDGITKLRKAAIANDVVLRGQPGNNTNVFIDGLRIYGACPGRMDPSAFHVDFAEVDRVEVTKGAFDISRQGNMAGSVNVIRKRPARGFHVSPNLNVGSWGYLNPSISGSHADDSVELSLGYSYRRSGPYEDGRGDRMTETGNYLPAAKDGDAFRIHTGWASVSFAPIRNQSVQMSYTRQNGDDILYPYLRMDAIYDNADRAALNWTATGVNSQLRTIRVESYYTQVRHWMTDERRRTALKGTDVFSMATFAKTRVGGGRVSFEAEHGMTFGFELFQRNWDAVNSMRNQMMNRDQHMIPNVDTTIAGAFADLSRSLTDKLRLAAGVRIDTAGMKVQSANPGLHLYLAYQATDELERRDTNPAANIRLSYDVHKYIELFGGVGSGVRTPDAQERYIALVRGGADWVGNPALRPSRNNETDLGVSIRRRGSYLKALAFHSGIDDFTYVYNQPRLTSVPGVKNMKARSYENVDARLYGGEVSFGASLRPRWLLNGGVPNVRASKNPIPDRQISDTSVAEIPPLSGRAALRYGTRRWFLEVEGVAASAQRYVDNDLKESPTAGWATMNVRGGVHFRGLRLTAGLANLLDRYYVEHLSYQRDPFRNGSRVPEPGRNLYLNIGYEF